MSIVKTWNGVIDATEVEVMSPTSRDELAELEFPAAALEWLSDPVSKATRPTVVEPLDSRVLSSCKAGDVSYFKFEPEDTEFEVPRFYVCFGRAIDQDRCISIRLDLSSPDWEPIEATLGFPVGPTFKAFAERFPGLAIGALDRPAFLMETEHWTNTEMLVRRDGQGRFLISEELLCRLREFLIFQIDYWAKAKLLDKSQQVWVYDLSANTLEPTGKAFEEWLADESWESGVQSPDKSS